MDRGIGVWEVSLFGGIILAGLTGFVVQSCNKSSVVNHDIEERQHEFDVKNPQPCQSYTKDITANRGECKPGTMPSIRYDGHGHDEQIFLFCTCPSEQSQEKTNVKTETDQIYQEYLRKYNEGVRKFYGLQSSSNITDSKDETLPFGKLDDPRPTNAIKARHANDE